MHAGGAMGVVAEDWLITAGFRMIIAFYSAVDAVNSLKGNQPFRRSIRLAYLGRSQVLVPPEGPLLSGFLQPQVPNQ
jgi:hypothetical protein